VNQEDDEADELDDIVTEKLDVFGDEDIGCVDEEVVGSTVFRLCQCQFLYMYVQHSCCGWSLLVAVC